MESNQSAFAGVPRPLRDAIARRGFASPSAVQQAVLRTDTAGRSLRISSQTGSGKTVALGFVLADHFVHEDGTQKSAKRGGPAALIITPTRELAAQFADELRWLFEDLRGLGVAVVTGGTDRNAERKRLARGPAIVVGTPGRLLDHIRHGALRCEDIAHVVLDEADRMLDMGFRDELDAIIEQMPEQRHSHLVSATFPQAVRKLADRFQADPVHLQGTELGAANADIEHVANLVSDCGVYPALVNHLLLAEGQRVLVFVERRIDAADLAAQLAEDGFAAQPFSGELSQAQRTRSLEAFRRGTIDILVSTDVAARGIDIADISLVVHVAPPEDPECYTHRSGRTGRAGSKGRSLLLVKSRARRYVERTLRDASVEVQWESTPTPARVRKALTKRVRRELRARIESQIESQLADVPSPGNQAEYAARLLQEHDPVAVVGALLEMIRPALRCEPMAIREPAPVPEPTSRHRGPRPRAGRARHAQRKRSTHGRRTQHPAARSS